MTMHEALERLVSVASRTEIRVLKAAIAAVPDKGWLTLFDFADVTGANPATATRAMRLLHVAGLADYRGTSSGSYIKVRWSDLPKALVEIPT
jgi:DNA-binding IclR family transcriptional regulator